MCHMVCLRYVILVILVLPCFGQQMSVNLKMFYMMEEELIALSELIISEERKHHHGVDIHRIHNMSEKIENAKSIHRDTNMQIGSYVAHPINAFHLVKRLTKEWKPLIALLIDSATCVKSLRVKIQNMEDTIPSETEFLSLAYTIFLNLEKYNELSLGNLERSVVLAGMKPNAQLTAYDIFDVGDAFLENMDFERAVNWLSHSAEAMKYNETTIPRGYSLSAALNKLATAYARLGNFNQAIGIVNEILKTDPENRAANRNRKYYQQRHDNNDYITPPKKKISNRMKLYENLCRANISQDKSKHKILKCFYLREWKEVRISKPEIKAEVLHRRPLVVLFHGVTSNATNAALYSLIKHQMKKQYYRDNFYKLERSLIVQDNTPWKWIEKLQKSVLNYRISRFPAYAITDLMATNVGIEGFLDETFKKVADASVVGTTLLCMTDATVGGEVVFPKLDIKVPVNKGDFLFYESGAWVSICPVLYGSQWYATMDIFQDIPKLVCPHKRRTQSIRGLLH